MNITKFIGWLVEFLIGVTILLILGYVFFTAMELIK